MKGPVDIGRVRRALATLDAIVARFPWLTGERQRARLAKELDDTGKEGDRGRHGIEEKDG